MRKHILYARYILRHKWYVFMAACRLGIPWLGLIHDWSKLRLDEWMPYARYFYGEYPDFSKMGVWEKAVYFGPTKYSVERAFDWAWLLHQKRNRHHWQYYILREDDGGTKIFEMPLRYRKEMLADWCGVGKALGKPDVLAWYTANKHKMQLGPDTRLWVEEMMDNDRQAV